MTTTSYTLTLPALRGIMGDWVFYSCLMDVQELGARVRYANELHRHEALSQMIQRELQENRGREIAEYLRTQPERFFSSLIVATYGGEPTWSGVSAVTPRPGALDPDTLDEDTLASVGFLTLRGDERLFALDGQHRLAGVKRAIDDGVEGPPYDQVSVIFVAHCTTQRGRERSRRLFTTLNKTARAVSKGEIIALDEDDVMAICVRRLIEETAFFGGSRVALVASNNMPASNLEALTTIGNLYDVLSILFSKSEFPLRESALSELQRSRPSDSELDEYFGYSRRFFDALEHSLVEMKQFFGASDTRAVVAEHRGSHGGSALFRPLGLEVFTLVVSRMTRTMSLEAAVGVAAGLPRKLDQAPYKRLMWDPNGGTIIGGRKVTLREILLYMVGMNGPRYPKPVLLERYRQATGRPNAELPERVV